MVSRLLALLAFALVVLPGSQAAADEVAELNEEGIAAFQEGRFEEAAQKFRAAWEIEPEPPLRKNEAIAWFKAGRCEEALEAAASYVSYGEDDPEAREDAESVIGNCKVELARSAITLGDFALAQKMLDETEGLRLDDFAREQVNLARLELARARDEAPPREDDAVAASAPPPEPLNTREMLGWVFTGTGGVFIASALIYHIVMLTSVAPEHEDLGASGSDRARFDELSSKLDTARWLVPTLYALGASSAGAGIYLLLDSSAAETSVAGPFESMNPRAFVLGLQGRF